MSRYPNMEYCAFENTSSALDQLIEMVQIAVDEDERLTFTSSDEKHAFYYIRDKLEDLMGALDQYMELEIVE